MPPRPGAVEVGAPVTAWDSIGSGGEGTPGDLPPFGMDRPTPLHRTIAEIPLLLIVAATIAFVLKTFVAQAFYIPSESMVPQLEIGDRVVVSKLAYHLHEPRRGDVVVFDSPTPGPADTAPLPIRFLRDVLEAVGVRRGDERELIKRVIGLPGESVEGRGGRVFIDGKPLVEPYLPAGVATSDFSARTVGEDEIFFMGDNRGNSQDSRVFGPVDQDAIVGRAMVRVWPAPRLAFL
jgi:signal peptidase I